MEFLEPVHIGSFITVSRELSRYKLGLVGEQEFGSDKRCTVRTGDYETKITNREQDHTTEQDHATEQDHTTE
jgi:hypothetical protein